MSGDDFNKDDIDKYIKTGTKVAFKVTAVEARNVHKLAVPDDVDEVWLEGKMGKLDVIEGGEMKVKIIFDRPSIIKRELHALVAVEAAKNYTTKSERGGRSVQG
jgi:hypothetical protein